MYTRILLQHAKPKQNLGFSLIQPLHVEPSVLRQVKFSSTRSQCQIRHHLGISSTHPYIYPTKADHRGLIQINVYKTHPVVVRGRPIIIQYQDEQNGQLSVSCGLSVITDHQQENLRVSRVVRILNNFKGTENPQE